MHRISLDRPKLTESRWSIDDVTVRSKINSSTIGHRLEFRAYFLFTDLDCNLDSNHDLNTLLNTSLKICIYIWPWTKIYTYVFYAFVTRNDTERFKMTKRAFNQYCTFVYTVGEMLSVIWIYWSVSYRMYDIVASFHDVVSWMLRSELLRSKNEASKCITDQI